MPWSKTREAELSTTLGLVDGLVAAAQIVGALAFIVVLVGGGISFIRGRRGYRHPEDFL